MILEPITSIKSARDFCSDYFNDSSPFLEYDFFKLLEDSKCTNKDSGWIPKHLIFWGLIMTLRPTFLVSIATKRSALKDYGV